MGQLIENMRSLQIKIAQTSMAVFLSYLSAGIALPVIPLFVHLQLGFSNTVAGLSVGIQFLATLCSRAMAGRSADKKGAKQATRAGMKLMSLVGICYFLVSGSGGIPILSLSLLLIARCLLGLGESLLLTGNITWGLGLAGPARSGVVMSWNGMAIYGALAAGAPLGLWLYHLNGFMAMSWVAILTPLLALILSAKIPKVGVITGLRVSNVGLIKKMGWQGLVLGFQGVGFAVVGTFTSLYYAQQGFSHAGLALSVFGGCYVLVRLFCSPLPDRYGGIIIAFYSLLLESVGLALLGMSTTEFQAILATALTGAGCSLVFPAMGVEVVKRVEAANRGTALGFYAAFQDLAYGLSGPIAGWIVTDYGFHPIFYSAMFLVQIGAIITLAMLFKQKYQ